MCRPRIRRPVRREQQGAARRDGGGQACVDRRLLGRGHVQELRGHQVVRVAERGVGVPLLERVGRGVVLTEAGQRLVRGQFELRSLPIALWVLRVGAVAFFVVNRRS